MTPAEQAAYDQAMADYAATVDEVIRTHIPAIPYGWLLRHTHAEVLRRLEAKAPRVAPGEKHD